MATQVRRPGSTLPEAVSLALDRSAPTPLSTQLAAALREAALTGRLRRGDRMPSTRALAARLAVSRTVTAAAYQELQAEGWIQGKVGAGTFVAAQPPAASRPPTTARPTKPPASARPMLDLRPGAPWADGIDRAAWRRAWRAAGHRPPPARREPTGIPEYRTTIAEHLLRHRGLVVPDPWADDGVLATSGTSSAAAELALAVLRPGDAVAIEEPGYSRAAASFRAVGLQVVPVPVDAHGLPPDAIPPRIRAVYCSPAHQYPLGARMPVARRARLVERARRHGWLIIEDDYDGELRYDVSPPPLLAALARDVVAHLGTTSKILSPSLGCGWMVAPIDVATRVLEHRRATSTGPDIAGQRLLVEMARSGDLARHLRRVRRELSARRAMLIRALHGAGVQVPGDDAGAHVVVRLSSASAEARLIDEARQRGLILDPLARHYQDSPRHHGVLVGYTTCSSYQLQAAGDLLCELLRSADQG